MKKQIKSKIIIYIFQAVGFAAALALVSFLFYYFSFQLQNYLIFLAAFFGVLGVSAYFAYRDMISIVTPVIRVSKDARDITKGLPVDCYKHDEDNELGELADSMNALVEYINGRVAILDQINAGDYSFPAEPVGDSDRLTQAIIRVIETNSGILHEIKKVSNAITNVSNEIANNAHTLATGSEQQAATVEEFVAVMGEVQEMANYNAGIARKTLERAVNSTQLVEKSNSDMRKLDDAMEAINNSSKRIENATKVIDEMAFQTNILALNAAVEAARAGSHGRGFAVVADEVRMLASKSAAAAKETENLIHMSINAINDGNDIMRISTESMASVGIDAKTAAAFMGELKDSSERQHESLTEINYGVSQISNVVQSNATLAQHNSISAQLMAEQAGRLEQLVAMFRLRDE